jgi:hypothetical protein
MPASAGLVYDNGSEVWFNVKGLSLDNGKVTEAVREALEGKQTTKPWKVNRLPSRYRSGTTMVRKSGFQGDALHVPRGVIV